MRWLALVVLCSTSLGAPERAAQPAPEDLEKRIAAALQPVLEGPAPGVVVGVLIGEERYVASYGETGATTVGAEHALFRVASMTKPVTALALARAVDQGVIGLDDPAVSCERLPGLCPVGEAITWRMLATHTSGLPTVPEGFEGGAADYTGPMLDAFLEGATIEAGRVGAFEYSTVGFALLGRWLAAARQTDYQSMIGEEILEPLAMRDACFVLPDAQLGRLAVGHLDGEALEPVAHTGALAPSGGLMASVSDMLAFLDAHLRPSEVWAGSVELALARHDDIRSFGPSVMALGWHYMLPMGCYWHSGSAAGYQCFMAFNAHTDRAVVVLTNAGADGSDTGVAMSSFGLLGRLASWSPPTD